MRFVYPTISEVFNTENEHYNSIVIENKRMLTEIVSDLYNQKNGSAGRIVVSENDTPVPIAKNVEIIDRYIPFELNTKTIINSVSSALEKCAVNEENIGRTLALTAEIEKYLIDLAFEFPCEISFTSVSSSSLIKHSGISVESNLSSISEKVCEYMELITEFDRKKLFVTINMRSFVDDEEMEKFVETALIHGYNIIAIESCAYKMLKNEKRLIIDDDLCEISIEFSG